MDSIIKLRNLSDIKPFKSAWSVRVKVLHKWVSFSHQTGASLEMVLTDQNGVKIQASCNQSLLQRLERHCVVGQWKVITNFSLSPASGLYRHTEHVFKMAFLNQTSITDCDIECDNMFLEINDFANIINGSRDTSVLIDVIGEILDVGVFDIAQVARKQVKMLEFTLRDINDHRLKSCITGKCAEILTRDVKQPTIGDICLIRFARIGRCKGELQLSNAFESSVVVLNPDIKEAQSLKEKFHGDHNSLPMYQNVKDKIQYQAKPHKWSQYPFKTIQEMKHCDKLGTASALETLCGQAYGAKLYGKLGIQMQRAMFVLLLLSIPLSIIWFNTEHILVLVHQNKDISSVAGSYARYMIPSLFAYGLLQCINRFLQAQNNVFPVFVCSGITTCLHLLLCWLFVLKTSLGYRGAALAISISYWFNVILLSCYVKFSASCSHSWTGFSKEAFHEIYDFSKIAFPSAVMVCLELWSFELLVLASGLLPNPVLETSVLSICLNTSLTIWQVSVGLGGAASIRVSNELGAGNPQVAKLAVYVIVGIAVAEGIVVVTVLLSVRKVLGRAFSSDPKIIAYAASMIPIVACGNFLDGLQCVLSGVARGCGWQKIGACINLGSYYLVGVPLGLVLGFHFHIGGRGLWLGIVTALAVQVLGLSLVTIFTNWDKEAKKATNRVGDKDDTIPK